MKRLALRTSDDARTKNQAVAVRERNANAHYQSSHERFLVFDREDENLRVRVVSRLEIPEIGRLFW